MNMSACNLATASKKLAGEYSDDLKLSEDMDYLKGVHEQNFRNDAIEPLKHLDKIYSLQLNDIFPELLIPLKIFLTIPVSVASGERSF